MPYITPNSRVHIDRWINPHMMTAGEINYLISRICDRHIEHHGLNYTTINELVGVLECAKLELYRRIAAPYEDTKISTNGDVYTRRHTTQ